MNRGRRPARWAAAHRQLVDALVAAGLVLLLAGPFWITYATEGRTTGGLLRAAVSTVMLGLLAVRRTHTTVAVVGVAALGLGRIALTPGDFATTVLPADPVAVMAATYAAARYGTTRVRWGALVAGLAGALGTALRMTLPDGPDGPGRFVFEFAATTLGVAGLVVACWTLGDRARTRAERIQALIDRAEELERGRNRERRLAVVAERTRIAREMHDVVAHSLSVIVTLADGGRYAAAARPDAAVETLRTIGVTGRSALAETRRLLGVLRGDAGAETRPLPGLADLPELVEATRAAGLEVEDTISGRPRELPPSLQLAVYRIVQESLTNVLKHAGPGTHAHVTLDWGEDEVVVTTSDDGAGAPAAPATGAGHGLTGMRERAALYGGRFRAGPSPRGGFVVEARLPYGSPPDPGAAPRTSPVPRLAPSEGETS